MKAITGFVFDLDGVITDTAKYHYQAWSEIAQEYLGITIDPQLNELLKGRSRIDSLKTIIQFGHINHSFSEKELITIANQKNRKYLELIQNMSCNDILPGINTFLCDIRANDIPMSLASASKNAPYIIDKLGLHQLFNSIADPEKIAHGKPAPDIFLEAAKLINSPPKNTIGIEDAYAGIEGIKAADMFAVGIGNHNILHNADFVVSDTNKLSLNMIMNAYQNLSSK